MDISYQKTETGKPKLTMSVSEMGKLLGLGKTESYYLVHKNCFETVLVNKVMRVRVDSFEDWYANQTRYEKVDGPAPGKELIAVSYSVKEIAVLLDIPIYLAYDIIKRFAIETFITDDRMRIRKEVFEAWYASQTKYRTAKDRQRDEELERASITLPQMAGILGISRNEVYGLISKKSSQGVFDIITVADRKRITLESFELWYQNQDIYHKVTKRTSGLPAEPEKIDDAERAVLFASNQTSYTVKDAALLIGVPLRQVYLMIEEGMLDSFTVGKIKRVRRTSLEWWLSPQDKAFRREEK